MATLANKLQDLESCLKSRHGQAMKYGRALRDAIVHKDDFIETEVLKSLGDLHLQKGKLSKDSAEFDKVAALYAAALLRCRDPDMGQALEHRVGYKVKLSRQLLKGYAPQNQPSYYWGFSTADGNVLRMAKICDDLDRRVSLKHSIEDAYSETVVTAITNGDVLLELETLKSLGDLYLEKGKKTSDVSQFLKAGSIYSRALRRYGEPGMKQTLYHRIMYAEKLRKTMRKQPSANKARLAVRKPCVGRQVGNIIRAMEDCHLDPDMQSQYKDRLKEGDCSLARADLDSAEQHFAAALRMVHVRDPTAQQYQREVEPLCKLGDVYSKRGQQTGDGGDFVQAAALYIAARARSKDEVLNGNIVVDCKHVESSFLNCILGIHYNVEQDNTEKHKKQLKEMRDQIKLNMETIDLRLNPYVHDEDDPCVKEIEAQRAQAVRRLFERISQERKEFISQLVEECIGIMGPPPCKYALIGLGSQATGLVTPYSDLEFCILVEEEREQCLVYFRNLTHYLHLKVVTLGETILPALGIKSLNDFYSENPFGKWYYDSVTSRGFAFDGFMPQASKTPLGREGSMSKPRSELICTPGNMVSKLQNDATLYLKEGYHLATILRNPCLIAGDQDLIDTYMTITEQVLKASGGKMAQELAQEMLKENLENYRLGSKQSISASMIDVKKDLYRFPAVAVDYLALSSCIIPTTVWKTIEEIENQQVISPDNALHLTVLTSISAELRLRTYIANGGQKENLSALASMETSSSVREQELSIQSNDQFEDSGSALIPVFHVQSQKQLFRYYYTAIPLIRALSEKKQTVPSFPDLYDNSPAVQGNMYFELCKYRLAIKCYNEALMKTKDNVEIALSFSNLGKAWYFLGDCRKAISYNEQALQMYESIYGHDQNKAYPEIATSLHNVGYTWLSLCDCEKAIIYLAKALEMDRRIHGEGAAHPDIASALSNLGTAWSSLGDHRKALSYYDQALKMQSIIYGQSKPHPGIATSLKSLGAIWTHLGDYRKATSYFDRALEMRKCIYGQTSAHPDIANSLSDLGAAWGNLGYYRKALTYHEQALQIYRGIIGHTAEHPDIAGELNSLGGVWSALKEPGKAISYYEQALQMFRNIYGHSTPHTDIAKVLGNLEAACSILDDHKKAISYGEQVLQMFRSIYGQYSPHPEIAKALFMLGLHWVSLGDHTRATNFCQEALSMARLVYPQDQNHPLIQKIEICLGAINWSSLSET